MIAPTANTTDTQVATSGGSSGSRAITDGEIAGITIACTVGAVASLALAVVYQHKKKAQRAAQESSPHGDLGESLVLGANEFSTL